MFGCVKQSQHCSECISEAYVTDEIITSRAGVRVRVNNTDAEGRMVLADVLSEMKDRVRSLVCLPCCSVRSLFCLG